MLTSRFRSAASAFTFAVGCSQVGAPTAALATPADALAHVLTTLSVGTKTPIGQPGVRSGIDLQGVQYVRVSASGAISLYNGPCGHDIEPYGCVPPPTDPNLPPALGTGTLEAAFTDANSNFIGGWHAVGEYATLRTPIGAQRLFLKINGIEQRGYGTFHVVVNALPNDPVARGSLSVQAHGTANKRFIEATRKGGDPTGGNTPATIPGTSRSDIQHLLRRFGFSDTAEDVTAIQKTGGAAAWLKAQLSPSTIDDSSTAPYVCQYPAVANQAITGSYGQCYAGGGMELQEEVNSKRQLLEKMVLFWMNHFSVSDVQVNVYDYEFNSAMAHYIWRIRQDAMGNFQTLLADIAEEPATQIFLNEIDSNANAASAPPNENFGREVMQLYSIGPLVLNPDGTTALNSSGVPIPVYSEADVKQAALLLAGFSWTSDHSDGAWPSYAESSVWNPGLHKAASSWTVMGKTISDPGGSRNAAQCAFSKSATPSISGPCVYTNFISMLAHQPTTWAYESKEMIERLVEENPSPAFVQRISTVWGANVDSPTQIASVLQAIADDPEFYNAKYRLVKEPVEYEIDAIRALHGADANPYSTSRIVLNQNSVLLPFSDVVGSVCGAGQCWWTPPNVFGFYPLGDKEALLENNAYVLNRWGFINVNGVSFNLPHTSNTCGDESACSTTMNMSFLAQFSPQQATTYLLDALVDGGNPQLNAIVLNYLQNNNDMTGAIWIILKSPEYEVN